MTSKRFVAFLATASLALTLLPPVTFAGTPQDPCASLDGENRMHCYKMQSSGELKDVCSDVTEPNKRRVCLITERFRRFKEMSKAFLGFRPIRGERSDVPLGQKITGECLGKTGVERWRCMNTIRREKRNPSRNHPLYNPEFRGRARVRRAVRDCKIYSGPERTACIYRDTCEGETGFGRYQCIRGEKARTKRKNPGSFRYLKHLGLPMTIKPQEVRYKLSACDQLSTDARAACRADVYKWYRSGGNDEEEEEVEEEEE